MTSYGAGDCEGADACDCLKHTSILPGRGVGYHGGGLVVGTPTTRIMYEDFKGIMGVRQQSL